jgi:hypothetical protein
LSLFRTSHLQRNLFVFERERDEIIFTLGLEWKKSAVARKRILTTHLIAMSMKPPRRKQLLVECKKFRLEKKLFHIY